MIAPLNSSHFCLPSVSCSVELLRQLKLTCEELVKPCSDANLCVTADYLKLSFPGLHEMLEATICLDDCLSAVNLLISQDR